MDLYVFVDNTCVEIFHIEKKNIDEINKYLSELENDEIKYEIRIMKDTCFENSSIRPIALVIYFSKNFICHFPRPLQPTLRRFFLFPFS